MSERSPDKSFLRSYEAPSVSQVDLDEGGNYVSSASDGIGTLGTSQID